MASRQLEKVWAEQRRRRDEEERRFRMEIIADFSVGDDTEATMHALAAEILRYQRCVRQLADAIGWMRAGALFGLLRPGPYWCKRPIRSDVVPPAA